MKAFSTAETVESAVAIATGKPPLVLSEEELVDCMPNPDACGGTGGCEGATQPEGFAFVSKNGMASEEGKWGGGGAVEEAEAAGGGVLKVKG